MCAKRCTATCAMCEVGRSEAVSGWGEWAWSERPLIPPFCKSEMAAVRGATWCLWGSVSSRRMLHSSSHSTVALYLAAPFPLTSPVLAQTLKCRWVCWFGCQSAQIWWQQFVTRRSSTSVRKHCSVSFNKWCCKKHNKITPTVSPDYFSKNFRSCNHT